MSKSHMHFYNIQLNNSVISSHIKLCLSWDFLLPVPGIDRPYQRTTILDALLSQIYIYISLSRETFSKKIPWVSSWSFPQIYTWYTCTNKCLMSWYDEDILISFRIPDLTIRLSQYIGFSWRNSRPVLYIGLITHSPLYILCFVLPRITLPMAFLWLLWYCSNSLFKRYCSHWLWSTAM